MSLPGRKPPIPAASGYPNYASALNSPTFAQGFTESFYPKTLAGNISTNSIKGVNLSQVGDEIIFRRRPEAEIFKYQKNQELEISHLESSTISMVINRAWYYNLKLDAVDMSLVKDLPMFIKEFQASAQRKLAEIVDYEMLTELPLQAHPCNKGRGAGVRSHMYDLGAKDAPVQLTHVNIVNYMVMMRQTLMEQNVDVSNMFIVLPVEAQTLFFAHPILANACASGLSKSIILTETIPNIMGMTVYFSNLMPQYNEGGKTAYLILAGHKSATGFVHKLIKNETVKDSRTWGQLWRGLSIYDFKVLTPEALSVMYATIVHDPNARP